MEDLVPVILALVGFAVFAIVALTLRGLLKDSKERKRFRRDSTGTSDSDSGWIVGGYEASRSDISSEYQSDSSFGESFSGGDAGGGGAGGDFSDGGNFGDSGGGDSGGDGGGGDGGGGGD